ncbi:MAG: cellulose synthase, partial [Leptolyngbya sp. SIO1D8]|nr:cellulose synthase [Leptolyngbya sp. SIO1D8]
MQSRLRDRTLLFRYLVIVNLMLGGWYLHWRLTRSLNTEVLWFSIPLLLAEVYMYVGGAIFLLGLWRPIERQVRNLSELIPILPEHDYPTVDVFITCCNEPVDIVAETASAALKMDYPVTKLRVYILDDGNSAEMRSMAEQLCLQDLQSPALQRAADRLNTTRYRLTSRLGQMQALREDLAEVEGILSSQRLQVKSTYDALTQVMGWFDASWHQ